MLLYDNVTLEDDVFCGPSMVFTNVYNLLSHVSRKDEYRNTVGKLGATLGANFTIVWLRDHGQVRLAHFRWQAMRDAVRSCWLLAVGKRR